MELVFMSACLQDLNTKTFKHKVGFKVKIFRQTNPVKEALFFKIKMSPILI